MRHLSCVGWSIVGAVVGLAGVAWAQEASPSVAVASGDPTSDVLIRLLSGGGLPAVLAVVAWVLRGQLGHGVPIVVRLDPAVVRELRLLRKAAQDRPADDSDDSTPSPPSDR